MKTPPVNASVDKRLKWLNRQLTKLAPCCPWTSSNPVECPLHDVRTKPHQEVVAWLEALTPEEKEYLVLYHQCCLVIKWEESGLCETPSENRKPRGAAKKPATAGDSAKISPSPRGARAAR